MATVWTNILDGFVEIFSSPFKDITVLWLLVPIVLFWLILEIYFARYKTEKLGWNTALGNGLSIFWVVVTSLKTMFEDNFALFGWDKLLYLIFIAGYSGFIIYISFTHKIKEKIFFLFTSPTIIYYFLGIMVLWVHGSLSISLWVFIDLILLYMIVLILETIFKKLLPEAPGGTGDEPGMGDMGLGGTETGPGLDTGMGGNIGKGFGKI